MQELFFIPQTFIEKTAGEVDLPDDPNQWAQQILQELYKQVPYITDYQPHVQMTRVDAERGYGMGHVEIQNQTEASMDTPQDQLDSAGIRNVRIPFVIREKKLSPFDLLINDTGAVLPLTENRIRQALFRPQAFDVTSRTPGDQSMIGQLYPPYRQNYGFGGGGMAMNAAGGMGIGKVGSALEEYLSGEEKTATPLTMASREKIKSKNFAVPKGDGPGDTGKYPIHDESHARAALSMVAKHGTPEEKAKVHAAVAKKYPGLASRSSVIKKASILSAVLPTITAADQVRFVDELDAATPHIYANSKLASAHFLDAAKRVVDHDPNLMKHAAWEGLFPPDVVQVSKLPSGYLVKTASSNLWEPKEEHLGRGDVVRRYGTKVAMEADVSGSATTAEGTLTESAEGKAMEMAPVTSAGTYKVVDTTGKEHLGYVVPHLVDIDGKETPIALFTNGTVAAVQSDVFGVPAGSPVSDLPSSPVGRNGAFYSVTGEGVRMTVPFEFNDSFTFGDQPMVHNGVTFDGRPVEVSLQPNIVDVTPVDSGRVLIPQDWKWLPLDGVSTVALVESADVTGSDVEEKMASVEVLSDGVSFSFRGLPLSKLANDQKSMLDLDSAMFLLGGLGADLRTAPAKLAEAIAFGRPARLKIARVIEPRGAVYAEAYEKAASVVNAVAGFKQPILVKEAASFPDPQMVDTVLSLGFINPENIMTFVSYLPDMEDVQEKLCELLFAVRVGLSNVPQSSLERAVRSLEEVIEGLKVLGFQGS